MKNYRKTNKINDYHKLEIEEIFESIRLHENIRIQIGTFMVTANLTLIGFGLSSQRVGLIFLSTIIVVMYMLGYVPTRKIREQIYKRGIQLEEKYASDATEAIMHRRYNLSRTSKKNVLRRLSFAGFWLPILVILLEVVVGFTLLKLGWSLF